MVSYLLVVYGYKKDGKKCTIGYQIFGDKDEATLHGQAVCDNLSSLTGVYASYGYDVDELGLKMVPQEV